MKSKLSRGTRTQLGVERLEQKQLLAGDVVVNLVNGHLMIAGDAEANQIAVSSGEDPGSYLVRGLDGTTVSMADAEAAASESGVLVEGVRGGVTIATGDGADVVRVNDANFRRTVRIATGEGDDRVLVGLPTPADATTETESEGDPVAAEEETAKATPHAVNVRGSLNIVTGAGDDVVRVADAAIGGSLRVAAGEGDDLVALGADAEFPADEGLGTGDAAEDATGEAPLRERTLLQVRGSIFAQLGAGDDTAVMKSVASRRGVAVNVGDGADRVALIGVHAGGSLLVAAGAGDSADGVVLRDVQARVAAIHTGGGADHVRIADSAFAALGVALGAGDDVLTIAGSKARFAFLGGGDGEDALNEGDGNTIGRQIVRNFEIPAPATDDGSDPSDDAMPPQDALPQRRQAFGRRRR